MTVGTPVIILKKIFKFIWNKYLPKLISIPKSTKHYGKGDELKGVVWFPISAVVYLVIVAWVSSNKESPPLSDSLTTYL